jgi:hypothetical protein
MQTVPEPRNLAFQEQLAGTQLKSIFGLSWVFCFVITTPGIARRMDLQFSSLAALSHPTQLPFVSFLHLSPVIVSRTFSHLTSGSHNRRRTR